MSDPADNALITKEEFVAYRGLDDADPDISEDQVILLTNQASQEIESHCGRKFITPSTQIEEVFSGDGEPDYFVRHRRVADPDDIILYLWNGSSWTELSSTSYPRAVEADRGLVYFNQGNLFTKGTRNFKVAYKYGWAQTALPADLKGACLSLVHRLLLITKDKEGMRSQSFGDTTSSWDLTNLLTAKHIQTLAKYRRMSIG